MKTTKRASLVAGVAASVCMLAAPAGFADEAEDSSAAFEANKANVAAIRGVAEAEATVTTHENGLTSAVVGLSALKMLVVKQNEDGTLTYGHVDSDADVEEFVNSETTSAPEEE